MSERVLVCGGRDFSDTKLLRTTLDRLHRDRIIDCVIEGNARGADRMAGYWARANKIDNAKFNADWATNGKAAGAIRNAKMLAEGRPTMVVAFPGGRGTADMVAKSRAAGVPVLLVGPS